MLRCEPPESVELLLRNAPLRDPSFPFGLEVKAGEVGVAGEDGEDGDRGERVESISVRLRGLRPRLGVGNAACSKMHTRVPSSAA